MNKTPYPQAGFLPSHRHAASLSPRLASPGAVRKRVESLSVQAQEALLDLEVLAAACPEGRRLHWLEEALQIVSGLRRDCQAIACPWQPEAAHPAALPSPHLWEAQLPSMDLTESWDEQSRVLLEARQILTGLHESLQRALAKQPRITGNLRCHLQFFSRELHEHALSVDRALEMDSPYFVL